MKLGPFFLSAILLLIGCAGDAPRDNPLDPSAAGFSKKGSLSGRILISNVAAGIADATVKSLSEDISVETDALGYFSFPFLSTGIQQFVCEKENFIADTFTIAIQTGQTAEIFRGLNGAPITTFKQILTRKIDQYFPGPQYFVEISAAVSDPNGITDLDSVWLGVVDTLKYPLSYSVTSKKFIASIYKYDFPTNTIQWLVGKPLTIISKDAQSAINVSDPFYITRVIENEATPISPSPFIESSVAADSVIFRWTPPSVTYNYSYTITLSRVESGTQTIVWLREGIGSFNEDLAYDGTQLESGKNYVWTITMIDDFGNYGRSKESAFSVK